MQLKLRGKNNTMKLTKEQLIDNLEKQSELDLDKNENLTNEEHADLQKLIDKVNKTKDTVFAECCNKCGFPIDIQRKPVIIRGGIISLSLCRTNTCKSCGHQKDGSTIPIVHQKIQDLLTQSIDQRKKLIKFFLHFHYLTKEQRKEVAVKMYQGEDKPDEPYSWNIVWEEVINDTERSIGLLNNLEL